MAEGAGNGRVVTELKTRSVSWLVLLAVATAAWLTSFDTDNPDDQMSFRANAVAWSDGSERGDDSPPCLKEGRSVPVKVGYTWVEFPDGGGMPVVAWVECLD